MAITPFDLPKPKTPCYMQTSWLCFTEPELRPLEVLHCGNRDFLFFPSVTLTLTQWHSYTNLTRISRRYTGCANMHFLHQGFWKLSSDTTDRQDWNYIPCLFAGGQKTILNTIHINCYQWHLIKSHYPYPRDYIDGIWDALSQVGGLSKASWWSPCHSAFDTDAWSWWHHVVRWFGSKLQTNKWKVIPVCLS